MRCCGRSSSRTSKIATPSLLRSFRGLCFDCSRQINRAATVQGPTARPFNNTDANTGTRAPESTRLEGHRVSTAANRGTAWAAASHHIPEQWWRRCSRGRPRVRIRKHGENALLAPKRKHLARISKTWMGRSGNKTLLGILIAWPCEMPTPPKRSYSARVASCFERELASSAVPPFSAGKAYGPRMRPRRGP